MQDTMTAPPLQGMANFLEDQGRYGDTELVHMTPDELSGFIGCFITGTAAEITPIKELDDRIIGDGKKGNITANLQDLFFSVVAGKASKFSHWLSEV